jgi:hypothetical protein
MPAAKPLKPTRKNKRIAEQPAAEKVETLARPAKYDFSMDLSEHNIPLYEKYLEHLKGKPCRLLEIGSFEDGSTTWFLDNIATHEDSFVDTIDGWEQPKLKPNLIAGGHQK